MCYLVHWSFGGKRKYTCYVGLISDFYDHVIISLLNGVPTIFKTKSAQRQIKGVELVGLWHCIAGSLIAAFVLWV